MFIGNNNSGDDGHHAIGMKKGRSYRRNGVTDSNENNDEAGSQVELALRVRGFVKPR